MRTDGVGRKSTRSRGEGNCVEVAGLAGVISVRDSKDQAGPVLAFPDNAWRAFLADQPHQS
ncbi:DUF397 domain-containing protein [Micromonospora sp. NPDC049523]|uniref:DUF397 domain-containing protein n=1 Tax=Micromonospora sp. NPDC049523 TaxID=3155921 RepID=UPI00342B79A2